MERGCAACRVLKQRSDIALSKHPIKHFIFPPYFLTVVIRFAGITNLKFILSFFLFCVRYFHYSQ